MRIRPITSAIVLAGATLAGATLAALPMTAAQADTTVAQAVAAAQPGAAPQPGSAAAQTSPAGGVALPLQTYFQMVVDSAHQHLFFSQGNPAENGILVTNFSGRTVATIGHQVGVAGIALSPDGKTLYAALSGLHEVTAISTATLRQTAAYRLGDANTPVSVAVQSGRLWVSYDTSVPGFDGAIGYFSLSAADPALQTSSALDAPPTPALSAWYSAPLIAADPTGRGNVLVAMQPDSEPANTASYDTAVSPPRLRSSAWGLIMSDGYDCSDVQDIAVVPGGGQFIPACDQEITPNTRFSTENFKPQGSYPTPKYSDAIAIAPQTGLVATGVNGSLPDVLVYARGTNNPLDLISAGRYGLAPRGLGLTANGSRLFALAMDAPMVIGPYDSQNPGVTLHVYSLPRVTAKLGGYYATARAGGVSYRLYHRAARLADAVSVAPAEAGQCVELQTQYDDGGWVTAATSGCTGLSSSGAATARLTLSKDHLGDPYRVRALYLSNAGTGNLEAEGGWQSFKVTG